METRSKSLQSGEVPDQHSANEIIRVMQSLKKSGGATQSTPVNVEDILGGVVTTTPEMGETKHSASEVINQSHALTQIEVLMQALFPGGVTVENLMEVKKIRDEREMANKHISDEIEENIGQKRAGGSFPSLSVGQKVGTIMSLGGEREFTAIGTLANADHNSDPSSNFTSSLDPPIRFGRSIVESNGNDMVMLNSQKPQHFSALSDFQNSKNEISTGRKFGKSLARNQVFDDVVEPDRRNRCLSSAALNVGKVFKPLITRIGPVGQKLEASVPPPLFRRKLADLFRQNHSSESTKSFPSPLAMGREGKESTPTSSQMPAGELGQSGGGRLAPPRFVGIDGGLGRYTSVPGRYTGSPLASHSRPVRTFGVSRDAEGFVQQGGRSPEVTTGVRVSSAGARNSSGGGLAQLGDGSGNPGDPSAPPTAFSSTTPFSVVDLLQQLRATEVGAFFPRPDSTAAKYQTDWIRENTELQMSAVVQGSWSLRATKNHPAHSIVLFRSGWLTRAQDPRIPAKADYVDAVGRRTPVLLDARFAEDAEDDLPALVHARFLNIDVAALTPSCVNMEEVPGSEGLVYWNHVWVGAGEELTYQSYSRSGRYEEEVEECSKVALAMDAVSELQRILATHFDPSASWFRAAVRLLDNLAEVYHKGFNKRVRLEDIWTEYEVTQPWMAAIYSLVMGEEYPDGFGDEYADVTEWMVAVMMFPVFRECFAYQQALRNDLRPYDRTYIDDILPTYFAALDSQEPMSEVASEYCAGWVWSQPFMVANQLSPSQVRNREKEVMRRQTERNRSGNPYACLELVTGVSISSGIAASASGAGSGGPPGGDDPPEDDPPPPSTTTSDADDTDPLVVRMRGFLQLANGDATLALQYMAASHTPVPAAPGSRSFSPDRSAASRKVIALPSGDLTGIKYQTIAVAASEVYVKELTSRVGYAESTIVAEAPSYRADLPLGQLRELLEQEGYTDSYKQLRLKTLTLPDDCQPPTPFAGKERHMVIDEVFNSKSPTVTQFLRHIINKAIQYHAPPIVIGQILLDAKWCTEEFKREWSRYKASMDVNNKVFKQPMFPDDLGATWMWMMGLIDTYLYNYKVIPQQYDITRILQSMVIKTEDMSGLAALVSDVMNVFRQQSVKNQDPGNLLEVLARAIVRGPGNKEQCASHQVSAGFPASAPANSFRGSAYFRSQRQAR